MYLTDRVWNNEGRRGFGDEVGSERGPQESVDEWGAELFEGMNCCMSPCESAQ